LNPKRLALGTAQFGLNYGIANRLGQVTLDGVRDVLGLAQFQGMDLLDTAIGYGDSERCLGLAGVNGWNVVTKLPMIPNDCGNVSNWVYELVSGSMQRLGVERLYGVLLHRPQQLLERDGGALYEALRQLKIERKVANIGVSIYAPHELEAICSSYPIDLVQAPFSVFDRRIHATGWLQRMADKGIEFHARSVFLQGLLLMSPSDRPAKFRQWEAYWQVWDDWLQTSSLSPLEACLRYVLSFSEVGRVVVGVDNSAQMQEIIEAASGASVKPPTSLACNDLDLINPSRWALI
jgi:aryl-alcohol dehydrogenase-like predicted oxidoreductase